MQTFEVVGGGLSDIPAGETAAETASALPAGAYTTFRTYGRTRVLRLHEHVRRLEESARLQGRPGDLQQEKVRRAVADAIALTGHAESRLRLTWAPPRLFLSVESFTPLPERLYQGGTWCVTVALRRDNPHAKDTRFTGPAGRVYDALPGGAHEGLMVADDGAILEGLSSNFFAIRDGALHTEEERVLAGLTRSLVLELAAPLLPRASGPLRSDQLGEAAECFITSASRGVLPVVKIDRTLVGTGRPGPLTQEIRRRFDERVQAEAADVGC